TRRNLQIRGRHGKVAKNCKAEAAVFAGGARPRGQAGGDLRAERARGRREVRGHEADGQQLAGASEGVVMANEIERHGGPLTDEEKGAFLRAYVEHRFNFRAACEAVGRHFTTMYRHLRSDAKFRAAFEEVRGALGDVALAEAVRRA